MSKKVSKGQPSRLFLYVSNATNIDSFGESDLVTKISEAKSKKKIGKTAKVSSKNPVWNYLCTLYPNSTCVAFQCSLF
jgi:hypothetical protein